MYILSWYDPNEIVGYYDGIIQVMVGSEAEILNKLLDFEPARVGFESITDLLDFVESADYKEATISFSDQCRFTLCDMSGNVLVAW